MSTLEVDNEPRRQLNNFQEPRCRIVTAPTQRYSSPPFNPLKLFELKANTKIKDE